MSGRRLQISLTSKNGRKTNLSQERPSSRTDQIVEASFSSDLSPITTNPQIKSANSLTTMPSISKLKEVLARTSEKLSVYTGKQEASSNNMDISDKVREISELKQKIRRLEAEK